MNYYFRKLFIEHPESVGENYFTHGYKACIFGIKLIGFGIAELVHSLVPGIDLFELCDTHSHIELQKLVKQLKERRSI